MGNDPPQGIPRARGRSVRLDRRRRGLAEAGPQVAKLHSRALSARCSCYGGSFFCPLLRTY